MNPEDEDPAFDLAVAVADQLAPESLFYEGGIEAAESLERKSRRVRQLRAWAATLDDEELRTIYVKLLDIIDASLARGREHNALVSRFRAIALPSLPQPE